MHRHSLPTACSAHILACLRPSYVMLKMCLPELCWLDLSMILRQIIPHFLAR